MAIVTGHLEVPRLGMILGMLAMTRSPRCPVFSAEAIDVLESGGGGFLIRVVSRYGPLWVWLFIDPGMGKLTRASCQSSLELTECEYTRSSNSRL